MKIKLWLSAALCFKLLDFSLLAQPLNLDQRLSTQQQTRVKLQQVQNTQRSKGKPKSNKKISQSDFDNLELDRRKKTLQQATGIIVSFKKWPSEKVQARLSQQLKKEGLTLTKQFKSFKALVFSWTTLKTQKKAESVCFNLSQLKNLNYCEPDALLHPDNKATQKENETEAGASSCTVDCDQKENSLSSIEDALEVTTPEVCELLSSKHKLKGGRLTDYWAQEMVGADLLRGELEKAPPLLEDKFLVAVFDSTSNNHNVHVQNLISHKGDQAVLPELNHSQIQFFETRGSSQYMSAVENLNKDLNTEQNTQNNSVDDSMKLATEDLLSKQRIPSFINNSMRWRESRTIYGAMSRIHPPAILVQSAGNKYPASLNSLKSQFSKDFDSIIVGSLSPRGLVSKFSQGGEEVHILAPSDNWITSVNSKESYKKFGGTSGAAPLVTGALAGFEWLSGYHPTAKEAKLLLEQTALPTIHSEFEKPRRNGVGTLNAYKMGMVGKKLKEKCNNNEDCFKKEIRNTNNYEFSVNEESILAKVKNAFPECSDQNETPVACEDKKSAFKKLRQALLLDIENISLLEKLHCIYEQEGFLENASNIEATIAAVIGDEDQLLKMLKNLVQSNDRKIIQEVARAVGTIWGTGGIEILEGLEQDLNRYVKLGVVEAAGTVGGTGGVEILEGLEQDLDKWIRQGVARAAGTIGGPGGLEILESLRKDSNKDVRRDVARAVGKIGSDEGLEILKDLFEDDDYKVREEVAWAAGMIGGPGGIEILKGLDEDSNEDVRYRVAEAAGTIGGPGGIEILEGLEQDTDEDVKRAAIYYIQKLKQQRASAISKGDFMNKTIFSSLN